MTRPGPIGFDWNDVARMNSELTVPTSKRLIQITKDPGAATVSASCIAAPTTDGTVTSNDGTAGALLSCATAATTGTFAGIYTAFTVARGDWNPTAYIRVGVGAATTLMRFWFGLFSADPQSLGSAATIHCAAFNIDTSLGDDLYWRVVTADSATATRTKLAKSFTANETLTFGVALSATQAVFTIDGGVVAAHTANLPTSTQLLGVACRVRTHTNTSRRLNFSRLALIY